MKSYLRNRIKQKQQNLREINDLQNLMRNLKNKSITVDYSVNGVKTGINNGLKGDNREKLVDLSSNINKMNTKKIDESINLIFTVKFKIQSEIDRLNRQLREVERQEELEKNEKKK